MKRYAQRYANNKEGCRGTITQRNVFEAADTTYLVGVFGGRPLKTPAAGSYELAERETLCKW